MPLTRQRADGGRRLSAMLSFLFGSLVMCLFSDRGDSHS